MSKQEIFQKSEQPENFKPSDELLKYLKHEVGSVELVAFNHAFQLMKSRYELSKYNRKLQQSSYVDEEIIGIESKAKIAENKTAVLEVEISDNLAGLKGYREAYRDSEMIMTRALQKFIDRSAKGDTKAKIQEASERIIISIDNIFDSSNGLEI
jgi:hypothetical protein